jgi:hypothetical protein
MVATDSLGVYLNDHLGGSVAGVEIAEKLGRLRTSKPLTGSAELSRLMDIESLSLGIEGKHAMWRELKEIADLDQRLAATDLEGLADRARRQRDTLEPYRLQCATLAFSADS